MQREPPVRASSLFPLAPHHKEVCVPATKMNNVQPSRRASALKPLFVLAADDALVAWRAAFARPSAIPAPAGNPVTPQKVDLGRTLFMDTRLSGDGTTACITCHDPALSFSDGVARRLALDGEPLPRRTPSLWNLAWGLTFFWDGRAPSLEAHERTDRERPRDGRRHRQG